MATNEANSEKRKLVMQKFKPAGKNDKFKVCGVSIAERENEQGFEIVPDAASYTNSIRQEEPRMVIAAGDTNTTRFDDGSIRRENEDNGVITIVNIPAILEAKKRVDAKVTKSQKEKADEESRE